MSGNRTETCSHPSPPADLEDEALEDGEGGGPDSVQGKDDIIELDGVHAPRIPTEIRSLWENDERGEEGEREG